MKKKNIENHAHRSPIRSNLAAKHNISHSCKLISGVFQQAAPFSEVFMLVSCVFCRSVATYQHIAVFSFAENGRLLRQDSSDNRPFSDTSKKDISKFMVPITMRKLYSIEPIIASAEHTSQGSGGYNPEFYVPPRVLISLPQDEYYRPLVPVRLGRVPARVGQGSQPK